MASEVVIRRAQQSDYNDVVYGIGDVFNGRDYLKTKYLELLEDPDVLPFVAEMGDEIVGFYCGQLVDNRRTLVKRAGRVKEGYRGKGIFFMLNNTIEFEAAKEGTVMVGAMACKKDNAERVSNGFAERKGFRLNIHLKVYSIKFERSKVPTVDPSTYQNVHEMTLTEVEELFNDEVTWNRLLHHERICVHYVPLRRVKENIRHVINHRTKAFMSFGPSDVNDAGAPLDRKVQNATMLSTIHFFKTNLGLGFNSDFYGADLQDLESHLQMHFRHISEAEDATISWVVNIDVNLDSKVRERLKQSLSAYGIQLTQNPNVQEEYIFERRFSPPRASDERGTLNTHLP
ncbi:uncharacterized protein LOC101856738 isoform X2 [Aplysia californica]|nr:uncharacterized protein LOC101856738 isoform X2 [Aplysia californica]XP_005100099.1 uncharacterized protein LOC101856738 isoform X2 [Aplysia californica]XP_005100100.1 uncharacterized protein LOC101856738 isoform X2 [Aplysia californica]XP_005100101.1 uncharacterized protein LOC101856738 isoform X2 [Aplysia californica]